METTCLLYISIEKIKFTIYHSSDHSWCGSSLDFSPLCRGCGLLELSDHPLPYLSALFSTQEWAFWTTCFISFEFSFPFAGMCLVPSTAERLASLQGRHGKWVEEMREGRRLAEIDGTRGTVCDNKGIKETERRYGERVWKEDQGRCMTENITSTKTHGT